MSFGNLWGTSFDALRLALSDEHGETCNIGDCVAGEAGADMAALAYVRRMRRMNLTGKATAGQPATASLGDGLGATWGLNWADKTFGQGLSSLTKGAKRLFSIINSVCVLNSHSCASRRCISLVWITVTAHISYGPYLLVRQNAEMCFTC